MQKEEVRELVEKYLNDTASKEEEERLLQWYWRESSLESEWELNSSQSENELKSMIYAKIIEHDEIDTNPRFNFKSKLSRLGVPLLFVAIVILSAYFYTDRVQKESTDKIIANVKSNDILPGGSRAILTLADGRKIELDESENGILVNQGGIKVHKNSDGIIEYTFSKQESNTIAATDKAEPVYNTIETPVGGKYQLNLADGTKVWLNSSSSLRFPIFFSEDNREVELKGEAYFEVSKDFKRKFSVRSGIQTVEVLGTQFNINAYSDEKSIKTTLFEGEIRVIDLKTNDSKLLKPGEQSNVDQSIQIKRIDTQAEIAWKEGYFYFKRADIETVMRQLGRWYGVTARYEANLPEQHFSGAISNSLTLLEVLEILEKSNIHFSLDGKEVIVMP
ncbi:FecR family protein [Daejeonella sp.]|uniref:FecR family protein n=1 Tax=Daejeonella sp. TaxID=2805397 RepID=UPI00272F7593|nr:FecR family protein [Daejeonella sp.]MDP2412647.1 FecR family protein [Daejeonella sp.]